MTPVKRGVAEVSSPGTGGKRIRPSAPARASPREPSPSPARGPALSPPLAGTKPLSPLGRPGSGPLRERAANRGDGGAVANELYHSRSRGRRLLGAILKSEGCPSGLGGKVAEIREKRAEAAAKAAEEYPPSPPPAPLPLVRRADVDQAAARGGLALRPESADPPEDLPESYKLLERVFAALDHVCHLVRVRGHQCSLGSVRSGVEATTRTRFTPARAAQLKRVYPEAVILAWPGTGARLEADDLRVEVLRTEVPSWGRGPAGGGGDGDGGAASAVGAERGMRLRAEEFRRRLVVLLKEQIAAHGLAPGGSDVPDVEGEPLPPKPAPRRELQPGATRARAEAGAGPAVEVAFSGGGGVKGRQIEFLKGQVSGAALRMVLAQEQRAQQAEESGEEAKATERRAVLSLHHVFDTLRSAMGQKNARCGRPAVEVLELLRLSPRMPPGTEAGTLAMQLTMLAKRAPEWCSLERADEMALKAAAEARGDAGMHAPHRAGTGLEGMVFRVVKGAGAGLLATVRKRLVEEAKLASSAKLEL